MAGSPLHRSPGDVAALTAASGEKPMAIDSFQRETAGSQ